MTEHPLKIISFENKEIGKTKNPNSRIERKKAAEANWEKQWQIDPEQFNPLRNCMEEERIQRTWKLIAEEGDLKGKLAIDLGCGAGLLADKFAQAGALVHVVDIADTPLKLIKEKYPEIKETFQQYIPYTILKDDAYDWVVSTEVIAYLPREEHRIFFSELSRLVKPNGQIICSTPLDTHSEDPLTIFLELAETEFKIEKIILSYHLYYLRLCDFFKAPRRFVNAQQDQEYRQQSLQKRSGIFRLWFKLNSTFLPSLLWRAVKLFSDPLAHFFEKSGSTLRFLEKLCRGISADNGLTHVIFRAIRRPLVLPPKEDEIPREIKHKKQVWE